MITEVLLFITGLLVLAYFRLTKDYGYWKKRGVKHIKPSFFFGNFVESTLFRKSLADEHMDIYRAGEGEPYIGVIRPEMDPALYLRDPDVIRQIMATDFLSFHDRMPPVDEKNQPLSAHLFSLNGARWRGLRTKLTPTFTSGKLKNMLPLMQECADELVSLVDGYAERSEVVEMREVCMCFTTDIIGSVAFGVRCNALRNPDAEFRRMGTMILRPSKIGATIQLLLQMFPSLADVIPLPPVFKKLDDFFITAIKNAVASREDQTVARNDFLDLLIQIRKKGSIAGNIEEMKNDPFFQNMGKEKNEDFEFTENLMAAQGFIFFLAGYETSATTMSYVLAELSLNPHIQEKLQSELDSNFKRDGNKFTYEALMKMPYLDKVVSEALRKYPPLPFLLRLVTQRYKMPNSDLVLEKGLKIFIPIHAIQNDPKNYPDPERFDPERFSEEGKQSRHRFLYLPFGDGPRNCIAMRFALLQVKLGIAALLQRFTFSPSSQFKYPPTFPLASPFVSPVGGVPLLAKRRNP